MEGKTKEEIQAHVDRFILMNATFFGDTLVEVTETDHKQVVIRVVGKWDQDRRDVLETCIFPWSFIVFYDGE